MRQPRPDPRSMPHSLACIAGLVFAFIATPARGAEPMATTPSPLVASPIRAGDDLTLLEFDPIAYERLREFDHVLIPDLILPGERTAAAVMRRVEVLAPGARVVVGTASGTIEAARPDVAAFIGTISGEPSSWVFVSFSPWGSNGLIESRGRQFILTSGPSAGDRQTLIYDAAGPAGRAIRMAPAPCAAELADAPNPPRTPPGEAVTPDSAPPRSAAGPACRIVSIALDSDWEYTDVLFAGNTDAAAAYAVSLLAAVASIYQRDLNVGLRISFLRVWSADVDPYHGNNAFSLLPQLRESWISTMQHVDRDLVHLLSARRPPGVGGIAFLYGVCDAARQGEFSYGASFQLTGYFPSPLVDHNPQNWDVHVLAHELGHNFGAVHTSEKRPRIDGCGAGDCSNSGSATIMSICNLCGGGVTNFIHAFHPRTVNEDILPYLESVTCTPEAGPPSLTALPAAQSVGVGSGATLAPGVSGAGPISYQWLHDGAPIPGATEPAYSIVVAAPADSGAYALRATNPCGSVTTADFLISVAPGACGPAAAGDADCNANAVLDDCERRLWASLSPSDPADSERLGAGVAVEGDLAVIGAPSSGGAKPGRAVLFRANSTLSEWSPVAVLHPPEGAGADAFGSSVAISGSAIVIGAPDTAPDGAAHVFERRTSHDQWALTATLTPGALPRPSRATGGGEESLPFPDQPPTGSFTSGPTTAHFGSSVAIQGNLILVGAPGAALQGRSGPTGTAYLFDRPDTAWLPLARLTAADAAPGDAFGASVALDAPTIAIGAPGAGRAITGSGAVYIFERPGAAWEQTAALSADDAAGGDLFGAFVGVWGQSIMVGAPGAGGDARGAAYAFGPDPSPARWAQRARIQPASLAAGDAFGSAIAIDRDNLMVGAPHPAAMPLAPSGAAAPGSAYLFRLQSNQDWTELKRLTATAPAPGDRFAGSLALRRDRALFGAEFAASSPGARPGAAFFARLPVCTPVPLGPFAPIAPADAARVEARRLTLAWSPSAGAASYTLRLDDSPAFGSPALLISGLTATSFTLPLGVLADRRTYFWSVTARSSFESLAIPASQFVVVLPRCPGDADGDRVVTFADATKVLANWGGLGPAGDVNSDGHVDATDLTEVLISFASECP